MLHTPNFPKVTIKAARGRYTAADCLNAFPPLDGSPPASDRARDRKTVSVTSYCADALTAAQRQIVEQVAADIKSAHPVLWAGDFDQFGARRDGSIYESQSDADLALAGHIARYLADQVEDEAELALLTEAVFNKCGLALRAKWQDREDYRLRTITKACAEVEVRPTIDWSLCGDVRNAKAFARLFQGKMLFVHGGGYWLKWSGRRWIRCEKGEELRAAKEVVSFLLAESAKKLTEDPDKAKRLIRETTQASNLPRLKAMLELAASEPGMGVKPSELDPDPKLLGVENGVVNLKTGVLQHNEPNLLITKHSRVGYDKAAPCHRWVRFLEEVIVDEDGAPDTQTIGVLQTLLGLTLTGDTGEEIIVFCVGFGANGKSVFSDVVLHILGEYAKTAPPSLLASRRTDDHGARSDMAMLQGARLVSINELPGGMHLDEVVAKQLAGREPIAARHLYGDFFSFVPSFTPWVRTNHKPIVKGDDDGIWRRIVILPFRRKFEEHQRDPFLEAKLIAESEGILAWMVEGARKYYRDGLRLSPTMKRETAQYRKESDLLGEFLEEKTVTAAHERVEHAQLYFDWKQWCEGNGVYPGAKKTFTQRLAERGFASKKSNGKWFYTGLRRDGGGLA